MTPAQKRDLIDGQLSEELVLAVQEAVARISSIEERMKLRGLAVSVDYPSFVNPKFRVVVRRHFKNKSSLVKYWGSL